MNTNISSKLNVVVNMPELHHWVGKGDGDPYDWKRSEVIKWLGDQEDVMTWLMDGLRSRGLIVYDGDSNTWKGAVPVVSEVKKNGGGRPRKYDDEVLLSVLRNEPGKSITGLKMWYRKVQVESKMSFMTFKRMADGLIDWEEVEMTTPPLDPKVKRWFPVRNIYRLLESKKIIPDSVPAAGASETTTSESST